MTIVGLVPCGGKAERLAGVPKWLMPLPTADGGCTYALAEMCRKLHTVKGLDWVYIGSGLHNQKLVDQYAPPKSIVYRADSKTMCEGVLAAKPHTGDYPVIMCMADTFFADETILGKMAAELSAGADCVVAIWNTRPEQRKSLGMVAFDKKSHKVHEVDDKPAKTALTDAWGAIGWKPSFWQYMRPLHAHMGLAINNAVSAGLTVKVVLAEGEYHDLGTIESVTRFYAQFEVARVK
jgi:UTP-glucose-1-phosphate uridylyltransferase